MTQKTLINYTKMHRDLCLARPQKITVHFSAKNDNIMRTIEKNSSASRIIFILSLYEKNIIFYSMFYIIF